MRMGYRKLRLSVYRKNEERRKYSAKTLVVSIPLSALSVMRVSIPLSTLPLTAYSHLPAPSLQCLGTWIGSAQVLPQGWSGVECGAERLVLSNIQGTENPRILFSLTIAPNFTWTLSVAGNKVDGLTWLSEFNQPQSVCGIQQLLHTLNQAKLCVGNPDGRFSMLGKRKRSFTDHTGTKVMAIQESNILGHETIRHVECEKVLPPDHLNERCCKCNKYRKTLRALASRSCHEGECDRTHPSSHCNYRYLTSSEKSERLCRMHNICRSSSKQIERLKTKIAKEVERSGIQVDNMLQQDLQTIMSNSIEAVTTNYPPNSFPAVFWQQQHEAARRDPRGMRWHPLMVKWCLYLRHLSGSAYETLRTSGVLKLPSQRSLRDYTHYLNTTIGFSAEVDCELMRVAEINTCCEYQKCVALIMDEMHVKNDLVYDKHTGSLIGFANIGDINNHLLRLEHLMDAVHEEDLAKSMLVFFVRGLFTRLEFPYAQFATTALAGDLLFDPFWEAVRRLEVCGFKVVAATADGATPNRTFFRIHCEKGKESELLYRTPNPFSVEDRYIFFFSDPPHLLKTARNCWASKKRHMWCKGKEISWRHLEQLYLRDSGAVRSCAGLALVPKLKYEHIYLTSFSKMRVDLAAQVLSSSVAAALRLTGGAEVEQTANFVEMMDRFFDCMNVSMFTAGKHKRNPFKDPFRPNDFRIKWLQDEFLPYLDQWEQSVMEREGFSKTLQNKMQLSAETLLGLRFTVRSFIDLLKYLFTLPGVKCFLSEKLCQDPLEKFFGMQRQRGRVNENPNIREFCQNTQAIRVINSSCLPVVKGNCRGNKRDTLDFHQDNQYICKRKTARKRTNLLPLSERHVQTND